ncbi:MAG: hypothetical protein PCFJNLEI_00672 [Verrucomicrobiae bacterium]|nr:hypothetical protein [Verrucomicrobiae bacterium]
MSVYVCSICNCVGITSGQWHHMAHHVSVAGRLEFTCNQCVPREKTGKVLRRQKHRFCNLCRERVEATEDNWFKKRFWCCAACRERIARDGVEAAIAESRKEDPGAATTFLDVARCEARCGLHKNAVYWYDKAIPTCDHMVDLGYEAWAKTLAQAKAEREVSQREVDADRRDSERVRRRDAARGAVILAHARLGGGITCLKSGKIQEALAAFEGLAEVCRKDGTGSAEWNYLHARALGHIGEIARDREQWAEAVEALQESLRLFEALAEADDKYAADVSSARDDVADAVVRLSLSQGDAPVEEL